MDALPDFEVVRPKTLDALIAAHAAHPQSRSSAAAPISSSISAAASSRQRS
jgi:hypothetical protein